MMMMMMMMMMMILAAPTLVTNEKLDQSDLLKPPERLSQWVTCF